MSLELCTIFACVVRLHSTPCAEALVTLSAFHSMLCHVYGGCWRDDLTLIIFSVVVDLACLNLHHIATRTSDKILTLIHECHKMKFINLLKSFFCHVILQFLFL